MWKAQVANMVKAIKYTAALVAAASVAFVAVVGFMLYCLCLFVAAQP